MKPILLFLFALNFFQPGQFCRVLVPEIAGEYEGKCKNGYAHGLGKATGQDTYQGWFHRGLPHGEGKYTWENGNYYEGTWQRGLKHGRGKLFDTNDESTISGIWKKGELIRTHTAYPNKEIKYQVGLKRNIDRYRFYRMGDGRRVVFLFQEMSGQRRIMNLLIDGSTGTYYSFGGEIGYENVSFPFEARIRFQTPSKMRSGIIDCEMHFTIREPGFWEVTISY